MLAALVNVLDAIITTNPNDLLRALYEAADSIEKNLLNVI